MQIEELIKAIDTLNRFEEEKTSLIDKQSYYDLAEQDILHTIENDNFNASDGYKLAKKIKNLRGERRQVKNQLELINEFQNNSNKLINNNNRKILISNLKHKYVILKNSKYHYKVLSKEEIKYDKKRNISENSKS